jgi:TfoX/Sxy family transcriptional regulator of competence genes
MIKRPQREQSPPVSEQMKAWSTAPSAELSDWPQVTLKSFFGFTALYRGKIMFGLLPRTRSVFKGNAVGFRMHATDHVSQSLIEKDPRIAAFDKDKACWFTFELCCDSDLHDALECLGIAFESARTKKKAKQMRRFL